MWARILEIARDEKVDAVLFAGDAFEKRHPSTDALLAFERPLIRHDHACPVIAIPGNHDRSGVSDFCALDVFHEAGLIELHSRPWVSLYDSRNPAIACLPWAPVSRIVAAHDGESDRDDVNVLAAELLLETARGLRARNDGPMILMTHFSITGASTPDGMDVGLFREPVLELADLEAIGFDAIVAGHIHRGQRLDVKPPHTCPIFYVGSPLPLDFGEAGCAHGVWLLDIDGPDRQALFVPIESRPFVTLDRELVDFDDDAVAFKTVSDNVEDAFVKLRIRGTEEQVRRLDLGFVRKQFVDGLGAHNVWVELDVQRELRARVAGIDETVNDTDVLELWMTSQSVNGDQAPKLRDLHRDYLAEVTR